MKFTDRIRYHFLDRRVKRAARLMANGAKLAEVVAWFALDCNEQEAACLWADAIEAARN